MVNNNKDIYGKDFSSKVVRYEEMFRQNKKIYFDEEDLLDIAEYYYYDMSKDVEALRCLDYALSLHPESLPIKLRKSEILYFLGHTAEAWILLNSITDQEDPDVQYYHGLFSLEEKNYKQAEKYYRKAFSQEPGTGIDMFCSIVTDYLEHDFLEEIEKWFNLLPLEFHDSPQIMELKSSYMKMKGQFFEAIKLEEKLIDNDPYNVENWISLTKLYIQVGEYGKANDSKAYIADIEPDNHTYIFLSAEIEFHMGNFKKAHEWYEKYLSLEDKDFYAYFYNAFCLVYLCRFEEALRQLYYAQKFVDDNNFEQKKQIHLLSTSVLICKGDLNKAKDELEKARNNGLDSEGYMNNSAMILFKEGNESEAISILNDLEIRNLKMGDFPENIFNTYIALGDYENLIKALDCTVNFCHATESCLDYVQDCSPFYALAYYEKNDRSEFLKHLKIAVGKAPDEVERLFENIFPESLDVRDYYVYAEQKMLNCRDVK